MLLQNEMCRKMNNHIALKEPFIFFLMVFIYSEAKRYFSLLLNNLHAVDSLVLVVGWFAALFERRTGWNETGKYDTKWKDQFLSGFLQTTEVKVEGKGFYLTPSILLGYVCHPEHGLFSE